MCNSFIDTTKASNWIRNELWGNTHDYFNGVEVDANKLATKAAGTLSLYDEDEYETPGWVYEIASEIAFSFLDVNGEEDEDTVDGAEHEDDE